MVGKRKGAGRPVGSTMDKDKKKVPYCTKLDPELRAALKAHELPAAKVIDRALRAYFGLLDKHQ